MFKKQVVFIVMVVFCNLFAINVFAKPNENSCNHFSCKDHRCNKNLEEISKDDSNFYEKYGVSARVHKFKESCDKLNSVEEAIKDVLKEVNDLYEELVNVSSKLDVNTAELKGKVENIKDVKQKESFEKLIAEIDFYNSELNELNNKFEKLKESCEDFNDVVIDLEQENPWACPAG